MFSTVLTASFQPDYGRTSFNEDTNTLNADLAVQNSGAFVVDIPLLVGIDNISDPSVRVRLPAQAAPGVFADACAHHLVLDPRDRQAVLETFEVDERLARVTDLLMMQRAALQTSSVTLH